MNNSFFGGKNNGKLDLSKATFGQGNQQQNQWQKEGSKQGSKREIVTNTDNFSNFEGLL